MNDAALRFMEYDYTEIKDLATQFLTLITAILVFSLTFSERIIEYKRVDQGTRNILIAAWSSFFLSIVACGMCLVLNAAAAGEMLYGPRPDSAFEISYYSAVLLIVAGCIFVLGLGFLIVAGIKGQSQARAATD